MHVHLKLAHERFISMRKIDTCVRRAFASIDAPPSTTAGPRK